MSQFNVLSPITEIISNEFSLPGVENVVGDLVKVLEGGLSQGLSSDELIENVTSLLVDSSIEVVPEDVREWATGIVDHLWNSQNQVEAQTSEPKVLFQSKSVAKNDGYQKTGVFEHSLTKSGHTIAYQIGFSGVEDPEDQGGLRFITGEGKAIFGPYGGMIEGEVGLMKTDVQLTENTNLQVRGLTLEGSANLGYVDEKGISSRSRGKTKKGSGTILWGKGAGFEIFGGTLTHSNKIGSCDMDFALDLSLGILAKSKFEASTSHFKIGGAAQYVGAEFDVAWDCEEGGN